MEVFRLLKCCHRHRNRKTSQDEQCECGDAPERRLVSDEQQQNDEEDERVQQQEGKQEQQQERQQAQQEEEEHRKVQQEQEQQTQQHQEEEDDQQQQQQQEQHKPQLASSYPANVEPASTAADDGEAETSAAADAIPKRQDSGSAAAAAAGERESQPHTPAAVAGEEQDEQSVTEAVASALAAAAAEQRGGAAEEAAEQAAAETRRMVTREDAAAAAAKEGAAAAPAAPAAPAAGAAADAAAGRADAASPGAATPPATAEIASTEEGPEAAAATGREPKAAAAAEDEAAAAATQRTDNLKCDPVVAAAREAAAEAHEPAAGTEAAVKAAGSLGGSSKAQHEAYAAAAAAAAEAAAEEELSRYSAAAAAIKVMPRTADKSGGALGASLFDPLRGLCAFRFWGPHVSKAWVEVGGSRYSMESEGDGLWSACLSGIKEGQGYHYALQSSWNDCFQQEGEILQRRDPYARFCDFNSNECFVAPAQPAAAAAAASFCISEIQPWTKWIIYELHPGTFVTPREGQTVFEAIAEKVDYIASLGFTAIELMPVQEFGGLWGYNPRLLFAVHSPYGNPETLKMLVNACHQKHVAVILDIVLNHGSSKLNSLWNWDGYGPNKSGGIYFEGGGESGWGRKFAFHEQRVRQMIKEAAAAFLNDYHFDALRLDSVHNMPWDLLWELTSFLKNRFPDKMLIAEVTPENPKVCQDVGFDACWIHSAYYDAVKIMRNQEGPYQLAMLKNIVNIHHGFSKSTQCVNSILGSHDQIGNRKGGETDGKHGKYFVSLFGGRDNWHTRAQCRMWYALQAVSHGLPMLFMGSELLQEGYWNVEPNHGFNWGLQNDVLAKQMKALVKAANELRLTFSELTGERQAPKIFHEDANNRVLGFTRGNNLLVVLNCSEGQWEGSCRYFVQTDFSENTTLRCILNSQDETFGGWAGSAGEETVHVAAGGRIGLCLPKWSLLVYRKEA